MPITRQQRRALHRLHQRLLASDDAQTISYRAFRRAAHAMCDGSVLVSIWSMWLGIERDGYTHS